MEKEMNAKTLDDLVKDIVREYPGFVVPDRGYWSMIKYSREKDEYSLDCDNRNCKGEVFGTPEVKYLELLMRDSKHQILHLAILL